MHIGFVWKFTLYSERFELAVLELVLLLYTGLPGFDYLGGENLPCMEQVFDRDFAIFKLFFKIINRMCTFHT